MRRTSLVALIVGLALVAGCQQPASRTAESTPAESASPAPSTAPETSPETTAEAIDLLPNLKRPVEEAISGGQPTPEQLAAASDAGYRTVINLRLPDEKGVGDEPQIVRDLGMEYISIPVRGSAGLTRENTEAFAKALDDAEYPLLVHCGSGNRIGAMFALKAFWVDGKSVDEAMQIGLDSGLTRLEGAVKELLEAESGA